mmetsp:Transcript_13149/g.52684  ORF Transcript_13149/g.52684 Transcript_13149/m.52684 type:complete len:254 (-) Transcript_13149:271-1032(-)
MYGTLVALMMKVWGPRSNTHGELQQWTPYVRPSESKYSRVGTLGASRRRARWKSTVRLLSAAMYSSGVISAMPSMAYVLRTPTGMPCIACLRSRSSSIASMSSSSSISGGSSSAPSKRSSAISSLAAACATRSAAPSAAASGWSGALTTPGAADAPVPSDVMTASRSATSASSSVDVSGRPALPMRSPRTARSRVTASCGAGSPGTPTAASAWTGGCSLTTTVGGDGAAAALVVWGGGATALGGGGGGATTAG